MGVHRFSAFKKSTNTEELELIPESTCEATTQAKSSCIAPAMLTYTEKTPSTSTNSDATGGAPLMKKQSVPSLSSPYNAHVLALPRIAPKPYLDV
ncbi:hypothetical protein TNCV_1428901 [Trichonephila clavipes]|nr:hypothetical protein TNCV_1428901 [Trichonephila clavipes]